MHGVLPARAQRAIFTDDKTVSEILEEKIADKNVSEGANWFRRLARSLWRKKPGAALAYLLGQPEDRNHHRWAAGDVEPKASVLRSLLRSKDGERVLEFVMHGCREPWWTERESIKRDAEIFRGAIQLRMDV